MEDIETKPNDMAFPLYRGGYADTGLTKREYFAAMAMQGLCSNIIANKYDAHLGNTNVTDVEYAQIAVDAVECADALITELNDQQHENTDN